LPHRRKYSSYETGEREEQQEGGRSKPVSTPADDSSHAAQEIGMGEV
jgi:hypothetical protein